MSYRRKPSPMRLRRRAAGGFTSLVSGSSKTKKKIPEMCVSRISKNYNDIELDTQEKFHKMNGSCSSITEERKDTQPLHETTLCPSNLINQNSPSSSYGKSQVNSKVSSKYINNLLTLPKPCYHAKMTLLCVQNALQMGARTSMNLCPPGTSRMELQKILLDRKQKLKVVSGGNICMKGSRSGYLLAFQPPTSVTDMPEEMEPLVFDSIIGDSGLMEYDLAENEYLSSPINITNPDYDLIEDASSGDEDTSDFLFDDIDNLNRIKMDSLNKFNSVNYLDTIEPLYTLGPDTSGRTNNSQGKGSAASGKLAFNLRKIRWFDAVTAEDRATARKYIRREIAYMKRKNKQVLSKHLRKSKYQEKQLLKGQKGQNLGEKIITDLMTHSRNYSKKGVKKIHDYPEDEVDELEPELDSIKSDSDVDDVYLEVSGVSKFPSNMTPGLSAALVMESLVLSPLESLEGMSKCYESLVAAGSALLDMEITSPTSVSMLPKSSTVKNCNTSSINKMRLALTKTDIMNALLPVLITSLEYVSGETVRGFACLRKLCGTKRYKRRFVQRLAPSFIRPPNAAMWCLRHQNDMEAILAVTELILDTSNEVFATGWYERGQTLLADSQRAETLKAAAIQLKKLSCQESGSLAMSLSVLGHLRRGSARKSSVKPTKDIPCTIGGGTELMAEWEILDVDRYIRRSINSIFTKNWPHITHLHTSPRDGDVLIAQRPSKKVRCINSEKTKTSSETTALIPVHSTRSATELNCFSVRISSPPTGIEQESSSPTNIFTSNSLSEAVVKNPSNSNTKYPTPCNDIATSQPQSPNTREQVFTSPGIVADTLESVFDPSFHKFNKPTTVFDPIPELQSPHFINDDINVLTTSEDQLGICAISNDTINTTPRSPIFPRRSDGASSISLSPNKKVNVAPPTFATSVLYGSDIVLSNTQSNISSSISSADVERISGIVPISPSTTYSNYMYSGLSSSSSVSSIGTNISSISDNSERFYHSAITSNPAERKQTVAACRALRAQISKFEEAFHKLHGRHPKGSEERKPLATTYAQYREWKHSIRADAAIRIQAWIKGWSLRNFVLKNGGDGTDIVRIVRNRSGRPDYHHNNNSEILNTRSVVITDNDKKACENNFFTDVLSAYFGSGKNIDDTTSEVSNIGMEIFESPATDRRTSLNLERNLTDSLSSLYSQKRKLKQKLKHYDMSFHQKHGRMPVKVEKEPIRHLYEAYNILKGKIIALENNGTLTSKLTKTSLVTNMCPTSIVFTDNDSQYETKVNSSNFTLDNVKSKRLDKHLQSVSTSEITYGKISSESQSSKEQTLTSLNLDGKRNNLALLKEEKQLLHQVLRSYEKDFFLNNNREVSSYADIRPVAKQYRRYKDIKRKIASLLEFKQEV